MFLIVGGTGALGSAATRLLLQRGHKVRVMTRNPQRATALKKLGVELVQGDLRDKASLAQACAGVNGVLAAAHSIMGRGAEASRKVDALGHKWLINAAQEAGVKHFVYTSTFGVSPTHPSEFYRIKHEVEQYLQHSGLAHTILRPTAFMESHAHLLIGGPENWTNMEVVRLYERLAWKKAKVSHVPLEGFASDVWGDTAVSPRSQSGHAEQHLVRHN